MNKTCKKCNQSKSIDEFTLDKRAGKGYPAFGRISRCKKCHAEACRASKLKNKNSDNSFTSRVSGISMFDFLQKIKQEKNDSFVSGLVMSYRAEGLIFWVILCLFSENGIKIKYSEIQNLIGVNRKFIEGFLAFCKDCNKIEYEIQDNTLTYSLNLDGRIPKGIICR